MERDQSIQQSAKVDHSLKTAVIFGVRFGLAVLAGGTAVSGCGIGKSPSNNIGGESDSPIPGAEVVIPQYSNDQLQAEGLDPRGQTAYLNYLIQSCQTAPAAQISSLNTYLDSFFKSWSSRVEAAGLEGSGIVETSEDFLKCTQDIEAKRPFLEKYGIHVNNWTPDNVLGLDTIANWHTRLAGEMQTRGFDVSQASIDALTGGTIKLTFVQPNGEVAIFTAVILDDKSEVDRRRAAGDLTAHWSGELTWMAFDRTTKQLVETKQDCGNKAVPVLFKEVSPTASATTVVATAISTHTSVPPVLSAPSPTQVSPILEASATPQPTPIIPTSTRVIPTSTHVPPTFTSVPTWEASATPQTNPLTPVAGPRAENTAVINPNPTTVVTVPTAVNTAVPPAPTTLPQSTREPAATPGGR